MSDLILDMLNTEKSIVITKTLIMSIFVYYTNLKITNKKININSFLMMWINKMLYKLYNRNHKSINSE